MRRFRRLDYKTSKLRIWDNFPQAYSNVGLIHAAFAASPKWSDQQNPRGVRGRGLDATESSARANRRSSKLGEGHSV